MSPGLPRIGKPTEDNTGWSWQGEETIIKIQIKNIFFLRTTIIATSMFPVQKT